MTPAATEGTYAMAQELTVTLDGAEHLTLAGAEYLLGELPVAVTMADALRAAAIMLHRDADRLARMAAGNPHAAELLGAERRGYRLAMATLQGVMQECGRPDLARAFHPDTRPL